MFIARHPKPEGFRANWKIVYDPPLFDGLDMVGRGETERAAIENLKSRAERAGAKLDSGLIKVSTSPSPEAAL